MAKLYKVQMTKNRYGRDDSVYTQVGTINELVKAYSYTLEKGASWAHEEGNVKINRNPRSIKVLVRNLYNADNNSASNGYSGCYYEEAEVTQADKDAYAN